MPDLGFYAPDDAEESEVVEPGWAFFETSCRGLEIQVDAEGPWREAGWTDDLVVVYLRTWLGANDPIKLLEFGAFQAVVDAIRAILADGGHDDELVDALIARNRKTHAEYLEHVLAGVVLPLVPPFQLEIS